MQPFRKMPAGQLVLVGDASDISKRGTYIHAVHPQTRKRREFIRWVTVAVIKLSVYGEIECILRDVSNIAPI